MATPSPSSLIQPHLSPLLLTLSDPSLTPLLKRNNIPSLAALLQPFQHSVDRVTVRSASYDNINLARFPVRFDERQLPQGFGLRSDAPGGGAAGAAGGGGRARSGSLAAQSAGLAPPSSRLSSDLTGTPASPATPFHYPSPAERDELFLDAVGARISSKVEGWLSSPTAAAELDVKPVSLRPRPGGDEDEASEGQKKVVEEEEAKEGWEDKTVEELAPWFAELRDEVFARREMVEWETFAWPVGCLLALSTTSPDPLNALSALWDLASPSSLYAPSSYPPRSGAEEDGRHEWADGAGVVRFVVLVHDWAAGGGREGWEDAQALHAIIRKTYGLHTALIPLFSASAGAKDPQPPAPRDVLERMYGHLAPAPAGQKKEEPAREKKEVVGLGYEVEDLPSSPPPQAAPSPPSSVAPNAAQEAGTVLPGYELSEADLTVLNKFVREMVVQSVIPFMERSVIVGNEQFAASKRGIGGRLFSAGRKYFGGGGGGGGGDASAGGSSASSRAGSPGPGGGGGGYNPIKGYYPSSSPPSQSRRLADLAFQLGDYKLAAQVYDSVAKDFKGDKAWRHYSAAVRMSGLSHLLLHPLSSPLPPPSSPQSPDAYLLLASLAPSPSTTTTFTFDALRSSLLYYEIYRSLSSSSHLSPSNASSAWALAPAGLLRAAEGIGEEVAAAVLLEQAALADLRIGGKGKGGKKRRYALHMAMAAARYEKCGVKSLSRRCLSQASTLYRITSPSSSSSDEPLSVSSTSLSDPRLPPPTASPLTNFTATHTHLHHSLARQAYTVGAPLQAVTHFLQLLASSTARPGGDAADGAEEVDWLDDFVLAWERVGSQAEAETAAKEAGIKLPVRLFDARAARIRVGSLATAGRDGEGLEMEGEEWEKMGEAMCKGVDEREKKGWKGKGKRPGRVEWRAVSAAGAGAAGGKEGEGEVEAVVGETFHLSLPVHNPLSSAFLSLGGLTIETDAPEGALEIDAPQEVELAPGEKSIINVPIRPLALGSYTLLSLTYRFASLLPVTESLSSPSVRYTKPSLPLPGKPSTRRACPLKVKVRGAVPVLSVDLAAKEEGGEEGTGLPRKLFAGETLRRRVRVETKGSVPIAELHVLVDRPDMAVVLPPSTASSSSNASPSLYGPASSSASSTTTIANHLRSPAPVPLLPTPDAVLQPGETLDFEVLCRGEEVGVVDVKWMFAFKAAENEASETFSTRAVHRIEVYPSLELRTAVQPNPRRGSPFILGVEAYNAGLPASDVRLTSLALISPRWSLSLAPGTSLEEDIATPLGWQQATTFFLSIDAEKETEEIERDEAVEFTVQKVESLLQGKEVAKGAPADVAFRASSVASSSFPDPLRPDLLASLLATYNSHRLSTLRTALPTLPSTLLPTLFPLISSAFLLAFYSSTSLQTEGHLLVPLSLSSLGGNSGAPQDAPLRSVLDTAERTAGGGLYEESQRERVALLSALRRSELGGGGAGESSAPAIAAVEVKEVVQHDFGTGPCKAPIRFHIRNISPTTPLSYTLNLGGASSRGATLAGALTHTGTLPPLALSTISTQLWIPRPGVHRAGAWRLVLEAKAADGSVMSWTREGAGREVRVRDSGKQVRRAGPSSAPALHGTLVGIQA